MPLIVVMEDDAATRTLGRLFVADANLRLKAIADSIAANDAPALAWAAHALTGATSNIGALAMHTVCSELESEAKAGVVPAYVAEQMQRLQGYWTKTRDLLASWV